MKHTLMVDNVNATPNFSAARVARIAPCGYCMPVRLDGARATGMATSCPIMRVRVRVRVLRFATFTATRWRSLILRKSSELDQ